MTLKYYYMNGSSPSLKVKLLLEEAKIPHTSIAIDLLKGGGQDAAYLAINPSGKVPAISIDGFNLGESNAINRFLALKFDLQDLYPSSLQERALIDQWIDFCSFHINEYIGGLVWNRHWVPILKLQPDMAKVERDERQLLRALPILATQLAKSPFVAGANYSLADICLVPYLGMADRGQIKLDDFPSIRSWLAKVTNRDAWRSSTAGLP